MVDSRELGGGSRLEGNKIILDCDCGCSTLVIEGEGRDYSISIQSSYLHHHSFTLWGRIKSAVKVLFGQPIYYADIYIESGATLEQLGKDLLELSGVR